MTRHRNGRAGGSRGPTSGTSSVATSLSARLKRVVPTPLLRAVEGFWAVPFLLATVAILGSLGLSFLPGEAIAPILPEAPAEEGADGLRTTLSVVATSVMSLTSIVFSLTFVALSLTAEQLSPRMLDFVLRERRVQVMIGLGLASFLFASMSLTLGHGEDLRRLQLASLTALGLAALTVVAAVTFVHRMTYFMRPDEMVSQRGDALNAAIERLRSAEKAAIVEDPPSTGREPLSVPRSGYVGDIAVAGLVDLAAERDIAIVTRANEGSFFLAGETFCEVIGAGDEADRDELAFSIARLMGLSDRTEVSAGAVYEARALAEGAIRALSPGINDPGTAFSCINRLCEAARLIIDLGERATAYPDSKGAIRVHHRGLDIPLLVERALLPLAEHARRDADVSRHLAAMVRRLETLATGEARRVLAGVAATAEAAVADRGAQASAA